MSWDLCEQVGRANDGNPGGPAITGRLTILDDTMIRYFFLLLTFSGVLRADEIDNYLQAQMRWQHIPGLSVMIVREGHLAKAKGYGLANLETGTPATAETQFKLASLSKQFVAAGIMVLNQDGQIHLDDHVNKYIDDVPESWRAITIRHLLTHTSGIVKDSAAFDPFKAQPDIDVIRSVYDKSLQFQPGDAWSYSNIGYYVLAEIIHRVTQEPWVEFIQKNALQKAGISGEHSVDPALIIVGRASGYEVRGSTIHNAEVWSAVRPSGGFLASALDLALWDEALNGDRVLNSDSRKLMWSPVRLNNQKTFGYGFGWFVEEPNGHPRVHHDGGVPGFSCDYEKFPDDHLAVAVLANVGERDLRDVAIGVAALMIPELQPPPSPAIADNEPQVTERLREVIDELAQGKLAQGQFSEQLAGWLSGDLKNGFGENLRSLGPIQSLVLIGREAKDSDITYKYRLEYRYVTLSVECTIGTDDRIKRLAIQS